MIAAGLLSFGLTHCCRLMKQGEAEGDWRGRLKDAPEGGYLAVDFIKLTHEGEGIEGVDRHYMHSGMAWGHRFTTRSLGFTEGRDPYVLRADAAPGNRMASERLPYWTPSEARLNVVGDVLVSGYDLKGVVVDADPAHSPCARYCLFLPVSSDALEATPKSAIKVKRSRLKPWPKRSDLGKPVTTGSWAAMPNVSVFICLGSVNQGLIFSWYAHTFD